MSRISANENLTRMVIDFMRAVAHTFYMSQVRIEIVLGYNRYGEEPKNRMVMV